MNTSSDAASSWEPFDDGEMWWAGAVLWLWNPAWEEPRLAIADPEEPGDWLYANGSHSYAHGVTVGAAGEPCPTHCCRPMAPLAPQQPSAESPEEPRSNAIMKASPLLQAILLFDAAAAAPWLLAATQDALVNLYCYLAGVPVSWHLHQHWMLFSLALASLVYAVIAAAYCALCVWAPGVLRGLRLRILISPAHQR